MHTKVRTDRFLYFDNPVFMVLEGVSLKPHNTFGIDVRADFYEVITSIEELERTYSSEYWAKKRLILGGGSNILFSGDFHGFVIKNEIMGVERIDESGDHVWMRLGAGEDWHEVVTRCVNSNLGGIENLSLIPGTVGAAPIQNIGAYGSELKDVFETLTAFDIRKGKTLVFSRKDCKFRYRNSLFKQEEKGNYFITDVTLKLTKRNHILNTEYGSLKNKFEKETPSIKGISDAVIEIRQSKLPDPAHIGNAGSFFKNPEVDSVDFEGLRAEFPSIPGFKLDQGNLKIPAAWLIEKCGWKGHRQDGFGVHDKQALVLVNYGGSKGSDIRDLAMKIKESVATKFGIVLEEEVSII